MVVRSTETTAAYLIPILALVLFLAPLEFAHAQQGPGENDPDQDPVTVNGAAGSEESEMERQMDEIMETVDELMWQNNQLRASSVNDKDTEDTIERNNEAILRLMKQLDMLVPPILVVEVSKSDEIKMNAAMAKLAKSGLPLLEMGIDPPTGSLGIMIDVDRVGLDTEKKIREITGDIDLTITYDTDRASFQSACNQSTGYCSPLVGDPSRLWTRA